MKLAERIIDLMAPFPGRPFRMHEIVNYANPRAHDKRSKDAVRKQVLRVLLELCECGTISIERASKQGSCNYYIWGRNAIRKTKSDNNEYHRVDAGD